MTIISHSRNFVFVHIHKCGGTSYEQAYAPFTPPSRELLTMRRVDRMAERTRRGLRKALRLPPAREGNQSSLLRPCFKGRLLRAIQTGDLIISSPGGDLNDLFLRNLGVYKHSSASEIRDSIGAVRWDQLHSSAIVRHPGVRLVSLYFYAIKLAQRVARRNGSEWRTQDAPTPKIKQQLAHMFPRLWPVMRAALANAQFDGFVRAIQDINADAVRPQLSMLRPFDQGERLVEIVWRLEERAFIELETSKLVGAGFVMPWSNRSGDSGQYFDEMVSSETKRVIEEIYAEDYQAFGYRTMTANLTHAVNRASW